MPLFALLCQDAPDTLQQRLALRPLHLARLQELEQQNRLVLAGPMPLTHDDPGQGFSGSLIVARFPDQTSAENWASQDPFLLNGVYSKIDIKPFIQALPAPL